MERVAVYCGTRNLYQNMLWAANSLLYHSNVEKIYFLIEDDDIGFELPPEIECINVSGQNYFREDGPNYNTRWTYMVLIRAALSKIFPNLDCILSLDVDTIVNQNINEIWEYQDYLIARNKYIAGVEEPLNSTEEYNYINMGVVFFNLKKMREDHIDDKIIEALNTKQYKFNEQDCINEMCRDHILLISSDYNVCGWTKNYHHRKITHYAAIPEWKIIPFWNKYKNIGTKRNIVDKPFGLDILVPSYNNPQGLIETLKSIYYPDLPIDITVIDDCSTNIDKSIFSQFPQVRFLQLEKNSGPGVARQYGINHTSNPYFMCVDCGDKIFSRYSLLEIIETIQNNTVPYIYQWPWINGEWNTITGESNTCTPGYVYSRNFIEAYNITYCKKGSYSNEDVGFNHTCLTIIRDIELNDYSPHKIFMETPVYKMVYDKNSITHKGKNEFNYYKQVDGLVENIIHLVETCKRNNISKDTIASELNSNLARLYYDFLYVLKKRPSAAQKNWDRIRHYYFAVYEEYKDINQDSLNMAMTHYIPMFLKLNPPRINIRRFIKELAENETIPDRYLTFF